jgi:hypothetical protein
MSSSLLLEQLAAARTIERLAQADVARLRGRARRAEPAKWRSGWRHRIGWRLVELGLRLAAGDPAALRGSACN